MVLDVVMQVARHSRVRRRATRRHLQQACRLKEEALVQKGQVLGMDPLPQRPSVLECAAPRPRPRKSAKCTLLLPGTTYDPLKQAALVAAA